MTDRELLELAAKAAGYDVEVTPRGDFYLREVDADGLMQVAIWNPLQFDGDALRLAVLLSMRVSTDMAAAEASPLLSDISEVVLFSECGGDPYATTRRAIVRAAAEIGRAMP